MRYLQICIRGFEGIGGRITAAVFCTSPGTCVCVVEAIVFEAGELGAAQRRWEREEEEDLGGKKE